MASSDDQQNIKMSTTDSLVDKDAITDNYEMTPNNETRYQREDPKLENHPRDLESSSFETVGVESEALDRSYRKMATLLVILCLINTVIYIRLFSSLLLDLKGEKNEILTSENKVDFQNETSTSTPPPHSHHPIILAFLLAAILFELLGLVAILCRSRLLLLLYGISMVVALVSLLFLLLRGSFGVLLTTVVNVFAIWRTYYFLVSGSSGKKRSSKKKKSQKRTRGRDQNGGRNFGR